MRYLASLLILSLVVVALDAGPLRIFRPRVSGSPHVEHAAETITTESVEALDEVNEIRARAGLRPFIRCDGLTEAAKSAAMYRAARRMAGHTRSDFAHLPAGVPATSAGCAAWPQSLGFGACCTHDNFTYAGAAWVIGNDGLRYCHIFVR